MCINEANNNIKHKSTCTSVILIYLYSFLCAFTGHNGLTFQRQQYISVEDFNRANILCLCDIMCTNEANDINFEQASTGVVSLHLYFFCALRVIMD
jgi:hypothetical protein